MGQYPISPHLDYSSSFLTVLHDSTLASLLPSLNTAVRGSTLKTKSELALTLRNTSVAPHVLQVKAQAISTAYMAPQVLALSPSPHHHSTPPAAAPWPQFSEAARTAPTPGPLHWLFLGPNWPHVASM